jgi:hypothetical protein
MLSNLSNAMAIKLSSLQTLIINMPLELQASRSKLSIWTSVCSVHQIALTALSEQFSDGITIVVSRSDLRRLAAQNDLTQYVLATVIWGYSSGMRGEHLQKILANLPKVIHLLSGVRADGLDDWTKHYACIKQIPGLGLSTYTKFLNFLPVQVQGSRALILDSRIIQAISDNTFEEFKSIGPISYDTAPRRYTDYLRTMHVVADKLEVSAEHLEFFLFEFGNNLKSSSPVARSSVSQ